MIQLAQAVLLLWLPIVAFIFTLLPPRKAVITSYIVAWLALPNIGYQLPGLPDYTKMSATVVAVLLCMAIFDQARIFSIRPRWFDLPIFVWCFSPFVTAITNDLGPYEGISAVLDQFVQWGLPYLIGRLYITDLESCRDLCLGIAIGALIYIPICLFELRMSPILELRIYGVFRFEPMRYGGYRPKGFLSTGLELGLWMTNATLISYLMWSSGAVKSLRSYSFGKLTAVLAVITVLCKASGAISLLVVGVVALRLARMTGRAWPVWLLIAIPPAYTFTRTFNLWTGQEVVRFAESALGADRAQSFEYRLNMENLLAERALIRPIFGWGRFNRSQIMDEHGEKATVPDGYWIITLGVAGWVGLAGLLSLTLLPMVLTIRRFPVRTWNDPQVSPAVALAMVMTLTMVDFLSNGMWNPIYAVTIGGLLGLSTVRLGGNRQEAEIHLSAASALVAQGQVAAAYQEFRRAIDLASDGEDILGRQVHAEALDGLGQSLMAMGRIAEAEHAFQDGLLVRDWLATHSPNPGRFRDLAIAREGLSRVLAELGRGAEAIEERRIALRIWDTLVTNHARDLEYRAHRVDALNDLAWLLSTGPDLSLRDPALALSMAEEAVRDAGDRSAPWNTLGVARYRAGDWAGAIEALERSATATPDGLGTAFDHYFLTMAWYQLQHEDQAREWLERGVAWAARHRPGHPTLERFREEAESLLPSTTGYPSLDVS